MPTFEYRKLKVSEVDPAEARYCFRFSLEDASLEESIRQFGILVPLVVFPDREKQCALISGFKRFYGALKLKITEVPVLVLRESMSDKERVRLAFENNRNGFFSPLDQAVAVTKLVSVMGFPKEEVLQDFFPSLGLVSSPKILEEFEQISHLEREILEAVHSGDLPFRGISEWARFSDAEQKILWEFCLARFYFTSCELVEFASLVRDLKVITNQPLRELLDRSEIQELVLEAENSGSRPRVEPLLEVLKRIRYPKSYEARRQFKARAARLKFDNPIQLSKSEAMEEEGVELKIRLANRASLGQALEELRQKQKQVSDIFGV